MWAAQKDVDGMSGRDGVLFSSGVQMVASGLDWLDGFFQFTVAVVLWLHRLGGWTSASFLSPSVCSLATALLLTCYHFEIVTNMAPFMPFRVILEIK